MSVQTPELDVVEGDGGGGGGVFKERHTVQSHFSSDVDGLEEF